MFDYHELRTILTLQETGSFSRTAEHLGLTQPAVSRRLGQLEHKLDCRLFEREPSGLRLTPAGRKLMERARQIILAMDNAVTELEPWRGQDAGSVRMACSHHIGLHHLPQLLKYCQQAHPALHFDLTFLESEAAPELLRSGRIDLALVTLPASLPADFHAVMLWRDPLHFVASPAHPLARCTHIALAELMAYPALLPPSHTETCRQVALLFQQAGLPLQAEISTSYLETLRVMVASGLGWGVMPATLCDHGLAILPVDLGAPPGRPPLQRDLGILHLRERVQSKAVVLAVAALRTVAG